MILIADTASDTFGQIVPPSPVAALGPGGIGISRFINTSIELIYLVATIVFVFTFLLSGLQWIISAGDKDKIAAVRKRLTWALIGITFLALAFVMLRVLGGILGFNFFTDVTNLPCSSIIGGCPGRFTNGPGS